MLEVTASELYCFNGDNIKIIHFLNKGYGDDFALTCGTFTLEGKQVNMAESFIKL